MIWFEHFKSHNDTVWGLLLQWEAGAGTVDVIFAQTKVVCCIFSLVAKCFLCIFQPPQCSAPSSKCVFTVAKLASPHTTNVPWPTRLSFENPLWIVLQYSTKDIAWMFSAHPLNILWLAGVDLWGAIPLGIHSLGGVNRRDINMTRQKYTKA